MNNQELKRFILDASRNTYASEDPNIRQKQSDFSTTIVYSNGDFSYHDNYFGGEPYGGREVVFYKGKPVWMMTYYGWVEKGNDNGEVYKILTAALRLAPEEMPYRGPRNFVEGEYKYFNDFHGDVDRFFGEEKINRGDELLYCAKYLGGFIDKT